MSTSDKLSELEYHIPVTDSDLQVSRRPADPVPVNQRGAGHYCPCTPQLRRGGPGPRATPFDPPLHTMEFNGKRIHFVDDIYRHRCCLTKSKIIFVHVTNVVSVLNKEDDKRVVLCDSWGNIEKTKRRKGALMEESRRMHVLECLFVRSWFCKGLGKIDKNITKKNKTPVNELTVATFFWRIFRLSGASFPNWYYLLSLADLGERTEGHGRPPFFRPN